ncbi:hypothetical protein C7972_1032 [Arenibacter sp. ARW7G5Y1]|nr:hypothetical protein C7972_1032 [Arenibacter sp. ARW7G5Y1]
MPSPRRKKNDLTIDLEDNAQRFLITENDFSHMRVDGTKGPAYFQFRLKSSSFHIGFR